MRSSSATRRRRPCTAKRRTRRRWPCTRGYIRRLCYTCCPATSTSDRAGRSAGGARLVRSSRRPCAQHAHESQQHVVRTPRAFRRILDLSAYGTATAHAIVKERCRRCVSAGARRTRRRGRSRCSPRGCGRCRRRPRSAVTDAIALRAAADDEHAARAVRGWRVGGLRHHRRRGEKVGERRLGRAEREVEGADRTVVRAAEEVAGEGGAHDLARRGAVEGLFAERQRKARREADGAAQLRAHSDDEPAQPLGERPRAREEVAPRRRRPQARRRRAAPRSPRARRGRSSRRRARWRRRRRRPPRPRVRGSSSWRRRRSRPPWRGR